MSRASLEDRISYCKRELASLEAITTTCHHCERKRYQENVCHKFGPVPVEFMNRTDCPDWEFNSIPF